VSTLFSYLNNSNKRIDVTLNGDYSSVAIADCTDSMLMRFDVQFMNIQGTLNMKLSLWMLLSYHTCYSIAAIEHMEHQLSVWANPVLSQL
jgi:hypothetical protein